MATVGILAGLLLTLAARPSARTAGAHSRAPS